MIIGVSIKGLKATGEGTEEKLAEVVSMHGAAGTAVAVADDGGSELHVKECFTDHCRSLQHVQRWNI